MFGHNKALGLTVLLFGVAILVGTLLVGQYRGTVAQHEAADRGFLNYTHTQAHTLGNFLDRNQYELDELSHRRVVTAYFSNKALGITLEYGLRISLLDLAQEMDRRLQRTMPDGSPVFSRLALVDSENRVVWDSDQPGQDPGTPWQLVTQDIGTGHSQSPLQIVEREDEESLFLLQADCQINERPVGKVYGFIPLSTAMELVNGPTIGSGAQSWFLLGDKPLLDDTKSSQAQQIFHQVASLNPQPGQILHTDVKTPSHGHQDVLAACAQVADLPLCIIRIESVDNAAASAGPKRVLINLVLALVAVVMGIVMFVHAKAREVELAGKLVVESDRNSLISSKNKELAQEIARRKIVEDKMKQAIATAEAANRTKGQFLANMSHEIRTPLNGILGLTELVLDTDLEKSQREHLSIALDSGKSLLHIINDILDISRIEAGRIQIDKVAYNLGEQISSIVQSFRAALSEKDLEFDLILQPGLPVDLIADQVRVRQILVNLLGNAIKFTNKGRVALDVSLDSHKKDGSKINFRVRDTGIGIETDKLASVFDSFSQADGSTTRLYGGSGLGLTISHHLAELMGGSLSVQSQFGKGSTFTLTLPLVLPGKNDRPWKADKDQQALVPDRCLNILVAEDNPVNQFYMKNLLRQMGHKLKMAKDGHETLKWLEKETFDLGLIDVQMPSMDGLEATRIWRQKEIDEGREPIPLIALTAFAMPQDRKRCLTAGMDDYLSKPVDRVMLNKAFARWAKPEKAIL